MEKFKNIAVYGGGSFGTALAAQIARCCNKAALFMRDNEVANEILTTRTNTKYLPNVILPSNLAAYCDLSKIIDYEVIIIAVPSTVVQVTIELLKTLNISKDTALLIAAKGFASNPTSLLSDRIKEILPNNPFAFIIGPNFAKEIAEDKLSSAIIASEDINLGQKLALSLSSKTFITSYTNDIITCQIIGAIKNIIAIKAGLYEAYEYGKNAKAMLIGQALKEIEILSKALGGIKGNKDILCEPALLGDIILTCYSKTSRNTKFGYNLGKSQNRQQFLSQASPLIEGRYAVKLALDFIKKYKLKLPIIQSVALELGL